MKTGIVGFAGAGKTSVFNALTGQTASTGFGGKSEANLGIINVPDARIDFLTEIYTPKKSTLAEIAFVDVPGPRSESRVAGLDTALLQQIQQSDALVHVIQGFAAAGETSAPDPSRDLDSFEGEMLLSDLMKVENRLERLAKEGNKASTEIDLMHRLKEQLDAGRPLRLLALSEPEIQASSGYQFMSLIPCMTLLNVSDGEVNDPIADALQERAARSGLGLMSMAASAEAEIAQLDEADQAEFLADLGLEMPARSRFIREVYAMLDLVSFLTAGEDECRAWTIRRGTVARRAAGKIHSDIERGFIRAEVIGFADFEALRSEAACREKGKMRLEGKDYEVEDGDIINFRFNV